jgi:alpha-glucosidase
MRIIQPSDVTIIEQDANYLLFEGVGKDRFRVSVLEHDLIRVQHLPDGEPRLDRTWMVVGFDQEGGLQPLDVPREGRLRDDYTPFTNPEVSTQLSLESIKIQTEKLALEIRLGDFQIQWFDRATRLFAADRDMHAYPYDRASKTVYHYMLRLTGEHYFGFGERSGPLEKSGRRMRMLNLDCLGYDAETSDPLYKHFPFYITYNATFNVAYGVFYDNLATTIFDMGCELDNYYSPYRYYQAEGGDVDYYLIYGPTIPEVVKKVAALTGRMTLPPRWSLGYLGSTMTYTEASNAQEQLKNFVDLCQQHQIPCDLFHLSSGYSTDEEGKRYVFNWNLKKIPDPKGMVSYFHEGGIKLAANIKPALLTSHPRYEDVKSLDAFIRAADVNKPELSAFWGGLGAHIDFTNPEGYEWWKQRVLDLLLTFDIDSTWNDNNEFPIWDDEARCNGFGNPIQVGLIRPLHTLLMTRASQSAQLQGRPDMRSFLISRSGCPGIQRYAQTWSGDNYTSWKTLRYNIPMGLGLSLSGAPNTGHDVGGFAGPPPDMELFVRWVQNGIFQPRFTIHSWNKDGSVNEPWMYPQVTPIIRKTIEFRYRLIPYLYSLFFEAARKGEPIIRPMVYHFPEDTNCRTESFDFMLGPSLLVASVLEEGARSRRVYLPRGEMWCDFYTGEWHQGGQVITAEASLERVPLFLRAGGVIPMGKVMRYFGEQPDDLRQAYVFPHPEIGEGTFTLIEDDGISFAYREGGYTELLLKVRATPEQITVEVESIHEGYELPYDEIEFILPPGEDRPITSIMGVKVWRDSDTRQHAILKLT